MSRLRYLNPFRIRRAAAEIRRLSGGGGPARVRLAGIESPRGWLLPTSRFRLEVEARDGSLSSYAPMLPVPWPYAWSYRVARRLGVPLVSSFEPEQVSFGVRVPRRGAASRAR